MRVLLVCNGPADAKEADPMLRRHVPLFTALKQLDVTPVVALFGDGGGLAPRLADAGVCVEAVEDGLPPDGRSLGRLPRAVRTIRALIRRHHPDLVEGDEPMPAIAAGLGGAGLRVPVVYRRHHAGGRRRLLLASRLAARLSMRTIVSSETMRQCAGAQDRTPLERIDVAASGAVASEPPAAEAVAALRASIGIPPDAALVLAIGRLRHEKGFDVLLAAVSRLHSQRPLHVVILGDGPERTPLEEQARTSPVPVHLPGHSPEVFTWLAAATIVVIPSRRESFGRVTLEAMAAGRPIVASAAGGLREAIVHDRSGLLVPPDNPDFLAVTLDRCLQAPEECEAMGRAARERFASRYTIGHMAAAWRDGWQRAIARRQVAA